MHPVRRKLELLAGITLLTLGFQGCDAGQVINDGCDEFCTRAMADDPEVEMDGCVGTCRSQECTQLCETFEIAFGSDAGTEQCRLRCLAEAADPTEPAIFQLVEARADIRIDRLYQFNYSAVFSDVGFTDIGACFLSNSGAAQSANFRRPAGSAYEDIFSIADPGDGSIIWGLYDAQERREWVGPGLGSASVECFFDDDLSDDNERGSPSDVDEDFIVCRLSWSGEASPTQFDDDNNVTRGPKALARIDVACLYTTPEIAGCDNDCDDDNPCTWDFCEPKKANVCVNTGLVSALHPIDCTLDNGELGACALESGSTILGGARCTPHPCGPDPCDDGDPCTYDFCRLDSTGGGSCQTAGNGTCF